MALNPDASEWLRWGIGFILTWMTTVGTWIVVSILRLQKHMGRAMTFQQHERICDRKNETISQDISELSGELKEMEFRQDRARAELSEKVETNRVESREDFQRVFEKIDDVASAIRSTTGTWPAQLPQNKR